MNPQHDDNLDRLLTQHLNRTLGAQLGKSETHFRRQVSCARRRQSSWRIPMWLIGSCATAAAAVWAVAMLKPSAPMPTAKSSGTGDVKLVATSLPVRGSDQTDVQYTNFKQTLDDGLIYLDDQTPVRKLRQQEVQQIEWLDDDGQTQMKVTLPKENVLFVEYPKS